MIRRLVRVIREELAALLIEPTMIICGASALLVISHYNGSTMYFHEVFGAMAAGHPAMAVLAHEYWFGMSVMLYLVAPLLLSRATNGSFYHKYGLGLGDWLAPFPGDLVRDAEQEQLPDRFCNQSGRRY